MTQWVDEPGGAGEQMIDPRLLYLCNGLHNIYVMCKNCANIINRKLQITILFFSSAISSNSSIVQPTTHLVYTCACVVLCLQTQ